MTTITEDYISFEVAKLLKEKGFECEKDSVTAMYNEIGTFLPLSTAADEYYDYSDFDEYDFVAPTQSMAMKWLREEYNIIIIVEPHTLNVEELKVKKFTFSIWVEDNYTEPYFDDEEYRGKDFLGYEKTCDVAIKYCLTNLL